MKIGFIGMGFVGGTSAKILGLVNEVFPYDKYKEPYTNFEVLKNAEVIFICLPTPMKKTGQIDYSAIKGSLNQLTELFKDVEKKPVIVIRSTAVSGTTDLLEKEYPFNFVFNPEFLREKTAFQDMVNSNRIVLGANRKEDFELVAKVYRPLFPNSKYIFVNTRTAEMIKYAANVLLASQIALANEIYQICQSVGVDYEIVKQAVLMDDRIGKNIDVPGHDGDFGFGGKCFPKDLNALIYLARENMYRPYLLEEVWRLNERVRKDKNWLDIVGATSENNNFNNPGEIVGGNNAEQKKDPTKTTPANQDPSESRSYY